MINSHKCCGFAYCAHGRAHGVIVLISKSWPQLRLCSPRPRLCSVACRRSTWLTGREILCIDITQETASRSFGFGRYLLLFFFETKYLRYFLMNSNLKGFFNFYNWHQVETFGHDFLVVEFQTKSEYVALFGWLRWTVIPYSKMLHWWGWWQFSPQ